MLRISMMPLERSLRITRRRDRRRVRRNTCPERESILCRGNDEPCRRVERDIVPLCPCQDSNRSRWLCSREPVNRIEPGGVLLWLLDLGSNLRFLPLPTPLSTVGIPFALGIRCRCSVPDPFARLSTSPTSLGFAPSRFTPVLRSTSGYGAHAPAWLRVGLTPARVGGRFLMVAQDSPRTRYLRPAHAGLRSVGLTSNGGRHGVRDSPHGLVRLTPTPVRVRTDES